MRTPTVVLRVHNDSIDLLQGVGVAETLNFKRTDRHNQSTVIASAHFLLIPVGILS